MQFSYRTYVASHIEKDIKNILSIFKHEKHILIKIRCDSQPSYIILWLMASLMSSSATSAFRFAWNIMRFLDKIKGNLESLPRVLNSPLTEPINMGQIIHFVNFVLSSLKGNLEEQDIKNDSLFPSSCFFLVPSQSKINRCLKTHWKHVINSKIHWFWKFHFKNK